MEDEPEKVVEKRKPGRPSSGRRKPDAAVYFVCNWEWKAWLDRFAQAEGLTTAELLATLAQEGAKRRKFETAPERLSGPPGR